MFKPYQIQNLEIAVSEKLLLNLENSLSCSRPRPWKSEKTVIGHRRSLQKWYPTQADHFIHCICPDYISPRDKVLLMFRYEIRYYSVLL